MKTLQYNHIRAKCCGNSGKEKLQRFALWVVDIEDFVFRQALNADDVHHFPLVKKLEVSELQTETVFIKSGIEWNLQVKSAHSPCFMVC